MAMMQWKTNNYPDLQDKQSYRWKQKDQYSAELWWHWMRICCCWFHIYFTYKSIHLFRAQREQSIVPLPRLDWHFSSIAAGVPAGSQNDGYIGLGWYVHRKCWQIHNINNKKSKTRNPVHSEINSKAGRVCELMPVSDCVTWEASFSQSRHLQSCRQEW